MYGEMRILDMKNSLSLAFLVAGVHYCVGQSIEAVIQRGHELAVVAIAASHDSNYVVRGRRDKSALHFFSR